MPNILNNISNMTEEDLKAHLDALRESRRKGYEAPVHKTRRDKNPFAGVDPEIAKKILEELKKRKEEQT